MMFWDDDERAPLKTLYNVKEEPPYEPIYVLIKEMYEEENAAIYKYTMPRKKIIHNPLPESPSQESISDTIDDASDDPPSEDPSEDPSEVNEHIDEAVFQKYLYT